MALPSLTFTQRDFSAGQCTEKAARRDDLSLQRASLKRSINTRPLATGALSQRFGRAAYNLDTGRNEKVRLSGDEAYEIMFVENGLRVRHSHDTEVVSEFTDQPWTLETLEQIVLAIADREAVITFPGFRPRHVRLGSSAQIDASLGTPLGDMTANTPFPAVISAMTSRQNGSDENHAASWDAGLPGDLLVACLDFPLGTAVATPSGWALRASLVASNFLCIFSKVDATGAAGSEAFITTSDTRSTQIVYRVRGHSGNPEAATPVASINPPSVTPSWGSKNNLWLAVAGMRRSDQLVTDAPADYTGLTQIAYPNSDQTSTSRIAAAQRNLAASSENPAAFTVSGTAADPISTTIAIQPDETAELRKVFDGTLAKPASLCVAKSAATSALFAVDFTASPKRCSGVTVYGSSDQGYVEGLTPGVTIKLYGKNGSAPTLVSPGDELGSETAADTANESAGRAVASNDSATEYDYLAVLISHDGAAAAMYLAQAVFATPTATLDTDEWLIGPLLFAQTPEGAKRQPYVRYSPPGVTMLCSARTGTGIDVTFSDPVLDPLHVGVSFRWHDREVVITTVTSPTAGKANVIEKLPPVVRVILDTALMRDSFKIGEVVIGDTSGTEGLIVAFNSTTNLDVIAFKGGNYIDNEQVVSPAGRGQVNGVPVEQAVVASNVWDEAMMSDFRGWPRSCTWDRSRLALCDFPQLPRAIAWSAIGAPTDLAVGAQAEDGFVEYAPGPGRVLHVIGGNDQYVLTDIGVMYIPISESNPLAPGRVAFRPIAAIGSSSVRPVAMHEGVVYASQNNKALIGIIPTGQTSFPYRTAALSEFHADLFTGIRCLAAMTGGGTQAEHYLWVCQTDGTGLVGKLDPSNEWVGFVPVTGQGTIKWISSFSGEVHFNTEYGGLTPWVMEHVDEPFYLDCAVSYHADNTGLRPDPEDESLGPLWFLAGETVDLMDGDEHLGTREVDADGFLVAEDAEDFEDTPDLVTGFGFTVTVSPWLPNQGEGEARGQRLRRRRVKLAAVTVQDSTEFTLCGHTFGGSTAKSGTYRAPGQGRSFDPEARLIKAVPGPLTLLEIAGECTT